jgi:hypothetical protein
VAAKPFKGIAVPLDRSSSVKRRYSVTSDVLGYRRCARQYGAFRIHGYAPAQQTQLYFGTILHQVLDRCHGHFHGTTDPATKGLLPTEADIGSYFDDVEDGLKSRGIRAVTPKLREKALRILNYFNQLEGPALYPRVVDTEHRLQADQATHILHGVVDLLADDPSGTRAPDDQEMWDYKGTTMPLPGSAELKSYEFQMRVYARLYELKHGVLPKKAVLYFLNALDGDSCPKARPAGAIYEVKLTPADIDTAILEFNKTVGEIEASRATDHWPPAPPEVISSQDCAICDLRWDCPTPQKGKGVALRYP